MRVGSRLVYKYQIIKKLLQQIRIKAYAGQNAYSVVGFVIKAESINLKNNCIVPYCL